MNLSITDENFNKNYRLPFERLCGWKILEIAITGRVFEKVREGSSENVHFDIGLEVFRSAGL